LALQGLGTSGVTTNLLPREILTERMIQQKKPWAVAAAAVLLLGCAINYAWPARSASNVADDLWQTARGQASSVASQSSTLVGEETDKLKLIEDIDLIGQNLVQNVENRVLWLELLQAINACLPRDPQGPQPKDPATIDERPELHITAIECSKEDDLSKWFEAVEGEGWYVPPEEPEEEEEEPEVADPDADETDPAEEDPMAEEEEEEEPLEDPEGPSDEGWIVKITGHHYHNFNDPSRSDQLAKFIQDEFIQKLRTGTVTLPGKDRKTPMTVSMKDLGISYPVLINPGMREEETLEDPNATADEKFVKALRFDFLVHFCWQPKSPTEREEAADEGEDDDLGTESEE